MSNELDEAGRPRWRGRPGRLEVHYLTASDERTGTGLWIHHELVAPTVGDAYAHGWAAVFPPDVPASYARFGPHPATPDTGDMWFRSDDATMSASNARGHADGIDWDITWDAGDRPLWTFPRYVWQRQLLPAAQVVPTPSTRITGRLTVESFDGTQFDGVGAVAHIYGHGNAHRWVWLHADLAGGDVLEIVAATARRPGLRLLRPLPLVQLRVEGRDWPGDPLASAPLMRTRISANSFDVSGVVGTHRLRVRATLPAERCVVVDYRDPDGSTATCTNSERADVVVETADLTARGWRQQRSWTLDGTGHAEIGSRP